MQKRICSRCGSVPEFSLYFGVYTLNSKPRGHKTTAAINLCHACINALCGGFRLVAPPALIEPLIDVYTKFAEHPKTAADSPEAISGSGSAE